MRIPLVIVALTTLAAACGAGSDPTLVAGAPETAMPTTVPAPLDDLPVTTRSEFDSDAILAASGFQRCPESGYAPEGDTTAERGQELIFAAVEAGIGQGGSPGGDGSLPRIDLFVLDEASLTALATFADPSELCINGDDPNDFVALGPQELSGPGWRWVGAGEGQSFEIGGGSKIIDNQADYDQLWAMLGEGPETEQIPVNFNAEVILAYSHGSGVNFGACGVRFDGYGRHSNGQIVLDFFDPGGNVSCDAMARSATYAIALERRYVGPIPFDAAVRRLPRAELSPLPLTVGPPRTPMVTEPVDETPPEPPPTTEPPVLPTVPSVAGEFAAGSVSAPTFVNRAGSTGPGGVDVPVPEAWEASGDLPIANVTGRGGLNVATFDTNDPAWRVMAAPDQLAIVDGPTAVAVPLYQATPNGAVTTGESASIQQYVHGSSDANTWLRRVVWVYDRGDQVTVAVLAFPEFPAGSDFNNDDPLQTSLAGQEPMDIMNDIRFFSDN